MYPFRRTIRTNWQFPKWKTVTCQYYRSTGVCHQIKFKSARLVVKSAAMHKKKQYITAACWEQIEITSKVPLIYCCYPNFCFDLPLVHRIDTLPPYILAQKRYLKLCSTVDCELLLSLWVLSQFWYVGVNSAKRRSPLQYHIMSDVSWLPQATAWCVV